MNHLLPKPLHRLALRIVHAIRLRWWRLTRKQLTDCRVIALGDGGRSLVLVRHSYGIDTWMLPGGALKNEEKVLRSAARELREETGCLLNRSRVVSVYDHSLHGGRAISHIVAGPTDSTSVPDGREILQAELFPIDALPEPMAPQIKRNLQFWLSRCTEADGLAPALRAQSNGS